jgi:hypothetical protein
LLRLASATRLTSRTLYENGAAQTACLLKGIPQDPPGEDSRRRALYGARPRQAWPMAAAMTDHIQNNPFGRSTDGYKDDWSAVQIGG